MSKFYQRLCYLFSFYFLVLGNFAVAQTKDSSNYFAVRANAGLGYIFPTQDFLKFDNVTGGQIHESATVGASFLFKVNGAKEWHHLYRMPRFGLGFQQFVHPPELGNPISVFGIFEQPLAHNLKNKLDWGVHLGMTFNWNEFDSTANPNNSLMGLDGSVYIHFRLMYTRMLSKHLSTFAVLGLTHGSNGALKMPNFGINIFDPRIGFQYHFAPRTPRMKYERFTEELKKEHQFSLVAAAGKKQIEFVNHNPQIRQEFKNKTFNMANAVLTYERKFSKRSSFGGGFDLTYDESANAKGLVDGDTNATFPAPMNEKLKFSLLLSYQLYMGNLSVVLQPGYYVYRTKHDPTPAFYQRIGLRYEVYKGILVGTTLRAVNFGQADWIEWTIGYKLRK